MDPAAAGPEPAPVRIVRGLYAAFARRDAGAIFQCVSPGVTVLVTDLESWGGLCEGIADAHRRLRDLLAGDAVELTLGRVFEVGAQVMVTGTVRGVARDTGAAYELPLAAFWTVSGDAVTRVEFFAGPGASRALPPRAASL